MKSVLNESTVELRHGRMLLAVDTRTGEIQRIEDLVSGLVHVDATKGDRSDGRLFRLIVPNEKWWSCPADSQDQDAPECSHTDDGLILDYPDLKDAEGIQTGIRVQVEIRPGGFDEFTLSMQIENSGPRTVIDATFPLVGGWHEHTKQDRIALGANAFIEPRSLEPSAGNNYARNGRRQAWRYPVFMSCPWVDVSTPQGGLSYSNYMPEGNNGKFWIENLAGYGDDFRLMFGWSHHLALSPGDSWTSPLMALAVHGKDWSATASRYADWFDTLHPPDYSRPEIRTRIGFQNVFFRGFDGTPIRTLDRIPEIAATGRRYGVDMLCVWDTLTLGNYARHDPHDLTDYPADEREELQRGLREAESAGSRTCALTNFRHPNVGLHLSDPDLPNQVQRRYTGTPRIENWSANHTFGDIWTYHIGPDSYVFSPFSVAHRERVLRLTSDYQDIGYTSMFYDQPFEHDPDYGFVDQGHPPNTTHPEALKLVGEVRDALISRDPQAIVIGEESDIHGTPYVDQWMSWSISDLSPKLLDRMLMMRYAIPHTILSWVVDHEPERAAVAFAMGMQLCLMVHGGENTLADEPAFAERVGELAELRKKTADRTVMARFRGHDGLAIEGDDGFLAYAYESDAGPAVIVAACGVPANGKVVVSPDTFSVKDHPAKGQVFGLDGSVSPHTGTTCEFNLGENDVAVWIL
jgi:hypothetical protein